MSSANKLKHRLGLTGGFTICPCSSAGKESACNAGDLGSILGLGRSPGEGKGYPLQYSGLENSMDCIVHGVAKSRAWLSDSHFRFTICRIIRKPAFWSGFSPSCLKWEQDTKQGRMFGKLVPSGLAYWLGEWVLKNNKKEDNWWGAFPFYVFNLKIKISTVSVLVEHKMSSYFLDLLAVHFADLETAAVLLFLPKREFINNTGQYPTCVIFFKLVTELSLGSIFLV